MPAVLLIFSVVKVGDVFELKTGATVPLKLITPVEDDTIALSTCKVCTRVPVNVAVPLLVKDPLTVKSPSRLALFEPKLRLPPVAITRSPALLVVPLITVYEPVTNKVYKVVLPVMVFEIPVKCNVLPDGVYVPLFTKLPLSVIVIKFGSIVAPALMSRLPLTVVLSINVLGEVPPFVKVKFP